jgi:hypothetical protein
MLRAFTSEAYQANPDQVRALAYTNRRVAQLNQKIRRHYLRLHRLTVCARRAADCPEPCLDDESIILPTSAECEVIEARRKSGMGNGPIWSLFVGQNGGRQKFPYPPGAP